MIYFPAVLLLLLSASRTATVQQPSSLEKIFVRAMQDLNSGKYQQAESEFLQILVKDPKNISVLINLGVLYSKTQRFTEAIDSYKKAVRAGSSEEAIQLNLGLAYLKQDNYADALPYFSRLHGSHTHDLKITTLLATCLAYSGKPDSAIALLQPITGPDSRERGALYVLGIAYTRADMPEQARETLARVFASAPPSQADYLFGEAYLDATDYPAAVQSFQSALTADSQLAGAHREMGRAYLGMHQNDRAEAELRLAIEADPRDAGALYSLGALLIQRSNWVDGRTLLAQAQTEAPASWATAFYLGKAEYELHDMTAAEQQLRRAIQLNPDEPGASYLLSRILRAEGHTEEAAALMQRVTALHATALDAEKRALESASKVKTSSAPAAD